jgi:hypothetical protein
MPTKTRMLDYGGFVHSPEAPMSPEFAEYLRRVDPLVATWQSVAVQWNRSPLSTELLELKKSAQRELDEFAAAYRGQYTIKPVERNPVFMPAGRFFARYRPIQRPFSILNCNLELPLHTVYAFENDWDLACVNAALDKTTPMRWWQDGPLNHPCYLFGDCVWELKLTELEASDKGLTLLFERTTEMERLQRDRLQNELAAPRGALGDQFIPEAVRAAVWRRDNGKCARCGSREAVDFCVSSAAVHGNAPTAQNVELLCARCQRK